MQKHTSYILYLLILVLAISCSTEKDKRLNKFYHNTTAYYNGYFNAREIIKVTNKDFNKNFVEDFSSLVPVNRYPDEEQSKAYFPDMNRAIDKTSVVISKHAMPNEKKGRRAKDEYGKWMDENWLTMGISYFYKREYPAAIEKFEYIIKMYEKDQTKYYAKLWLAKSYIEMENYPKALSYLNEIKVEKEAKELSDEKEAKRGGRKYSKKQKKRVSKRSKVKVTKKRAEKKAERSFLVEFPKKMASDYFATLADYYLRKGEYKDAVQLLDSALNYTKAKKRKVRYKFIQAQLNQEQGNKIKASELYSYVIKKNNNYQMGFYSRINRALLASSSNRGVLKKELEKLAKDEKYIEFRDQIYYALADIELQQANKETGIDYLEQSASYPPSNKTQKGKTFLRLADVYFENKEYVPAQKYYDSTLTELDKESLKYTQIKDKNESLTRLVSYINNIILKDSLVQIGLLPEKQRRDRVEDILYKEKIQKLEEKRLKEEASNAPVIAEGGLPGNNIGQKGSFWIYNEKVKAQGVKSFKAVWGNAKLEDNWRRSNKSQTGEGEVVDINNSPVIGDKEIDEYLSKVPVTKEEIAEAQMSIINSNYLSGLIYVNVLDNNPEAIKSFKDNKKRYHPNIKITPSLYQLYVLYQEINQNEDVVAVKNFILNKYPESREAKIILDPNYADKLNKGEKKYENSYMIAYNLVMNGRNKEAVSHIDKVLAEKDPNPFECKLLFLKARVYSNFGDKENLEKSLAAVVKTCPNTEVGSIAEKALGKLRNEINKVEDNQEVAFVVNEKSVHYFAIVVPLSKDVNKLKIALSNFNSSSFDEKGLKISAIGLNKTHQTILVKQLDTKVEAHSYYVAFKVNPKMKDFITKFEYFTITPKNYSILFQNKDLKKYQEFYNINYL
jgi:tetratricopeptide (TPR) repeat protein